VWFWKVKVPGAIRFSRLYGRLHATTRSCLQNDFNISISIFVCLLFLFLTCPCLQHDVIASGFRVHVLGLTLLTVKSVGDWIEASKGCRWPLVASLPVLKHICTACVCVCVCVCVCLVQRLLALP